MRNPDDFFGRARAYCTLLLCANLAWSVGCSQANLRVEVPEGAIVPDRCMVMFFVDGLDHPVYDEMLAGGELPAIEKYIVRRGVSVDNAIACIPSITYGVTVTLLTGLDPGHHGIIGNNWFDRQSLIARVYTESGTFRAVNADFSAPTVYDALGDRLTVSFQNACQRGATRTLDNWAVAGVCWFFKWHLAIDRTVGDNFDALAGLARQAGRWPDFVQAYFPGVDARGHQVGADHPLYRQACRNVDTQIGRICDALARAGLLDRTYLALVSDHGHAPCAHENYVELTPWLAKAFGWKIHDGRRDTGTLEQRRRYFAGVDAVALNGGNRQYKLYLRGADGWSSRPSFEQCREVLTGGCPSLGTLPPVFVGVCRKGPEQVWIYGRDGDATVSRRSHDNESEYRYDVGSGDPLGYLADAKLAEFVRSGWHGSRAWLAVTAESRCPDVPAQIVEFFDSPRAPDIEVFAVEGWDFSHENVGGHGSIVRRDMWVPMVWAGPGIAAGRRIPTARVTDVAPTVVELLAGRERLREMGRIDGISLVPQLRGAETVARRGRGRQSVRLRAKP